MDQDKKKGRVVAFHNRKGGVGKTTLSGNFAALMAKKVRAKGGKVMYLDLDTQANASQDFLGFTVPYLIQNPVDFPNVLNLVGVDDPESNIHVPKLPIPPLVQKTNLNLYTIAQHKQMDLFLSKAYGFDYGIFMEPFEELRKEYDWIILDLPPAQDIVTRAALAASDYLIMPVGNSNSTVQYVPEFIKEDFEIIKAYNENITFLGMVHNLADRYSVNFYEETLKNLSKEYGIYLYDTEIRNSVGLRDINSDSLKSLKTRANMNRCVVACDNFIFKTYPKAYKDFEDFATETIHLIEKAEKKGGKTQ